MSVSLAALKASLADLPGIQALSMEILAGRHNYQIGGKVVGVDPNASQESIEAAIRASVASPGIAGIPAGANNSASLLPSVSMGAPAKQESKPMKTNPAPGGFAAMVRSMLSDARAGIQEAQASVLVDVQKAVDEMHDAKERTKQVGAGMVNSIRNETAAALAELGQFTNDLGGGQ